MAQRRSGRSASESAQFPRGTIGGIADIPPRLRGVSRSVRRSLIDFKHGPGRRCHRVQLAACHWKHRHRGSPDCVPALGAFWASCKASSQGCTRQDTVKGSRSPAGFQNRVRGSLVFGTATGTRAGTALHWATGPEGRRASGGRGRTRRGRSLLFRSPWTGEMARPPEARDRPRDSARAPAPYGSPSMAAD